MNKIFFIFITIFFVNNAFGNINNSCGQISQTNKIDNNKIEIEVNFDFLKECIFYTSGKQDLGMEPTAIVDNTNIEIGEIKWPKGIVKTEIIDNTEYKNNIINGKFKVLIPIKIKNHKKNKNFNITINYQICYNSQCKNEEFFIQNSNNNILIINENDGTDKFEFKNKNSKNTSFIVMIILAFLGGAVLNFMPCVLPVLGIKLASLSHGNKTAKEIKFAAIVSLFGIVASFITLGLLSSFIKLPFTEQTNDIQLWGSMFQNKYFVVILALLVAVFIDIQRGRCQISINIDNKFNGSLYHFFSAVLSTILASPCIAPIVGLFLVFSSNASFIAGIIIFLSISLGFGLPYIITFFYPDIYKKIPKSGKISMILSGLMQFLLFLTFFWLLYVICMQIGLHSTLIVMVCVFIFSHLGWKMKKNISRLILIVALLIPIFAIVYISNDDKSIENKMWSNYSSELLDKSLLSNNVVLVLGTADWCSWCHILEKTVLERDKFIAFVKDKNIAMLKADLTDSNNKSANEFYQSQNQPGLPILTIYSNANPNGKSLIFDSFSIDSVIKEIENEIKLNSDVQN